MTAAFNANLARVFPPPVMEARRWLAETKLPEGKALLNVSQAAPVDPPPEGMRQAMAEAVLAAPETHLYGPVLGDSALRDALAVRTAAIYAGSVSVPDVAVTLGCNQAFCAAVATLCAPGDAVLVPVPWYFNHKMWLDMAGVEARPIPCGPDMLPDPEAAAAAMTPEVKAVLLITPNNPCGVEYPADLVDAFFDLAAQSGAALIVDETYRDFHSGQGAPHRLFQRTDWRETLVHLYSFSKVYRLTGHRVGAMIAGPERLAQAEKFLDTVTICPSQVGQVGALWGLRHLDQWVAAERAEVLARRAALQAAFAKDLPDWRVTGAGAYFAWVEAPFDRPAADLALRLLADQAVLALPGTMFTPDTGDWGGGRALRIAFANSDADGIADLAQRLAAFRP
ncbi:MAG: aminotransferase [Pseudomonadota bacterium]